VKRGAADVRNVTEHPRRLQMSDKKNVASEEMAEWETRQFVIQKIREFKIFKIQGQYY
jgi:hypothetical protein